MRINYEQFAHPSYSKLEQLIPQPGEIWQINRSPKSPLLFTPEESKNLYSEPARNFLERNSPSRYVMIVQEPKVMTEEERWQTVSVMTFSEETSFLSNVDILIPSQVSNFNKDLLAETWQVLPMLACNLDHSVGRRLSRNCYDTLLDIGDFYHDLIDEPPSLQKIQSLGLQINPEITEEIAEIRDFHQKEKTWADVLTVPVNAKHTYSKMIDLTLTGMIVGEIIDFEEDVAPKKQVSLTKWLKEKIFEEEWIDIEQFWTKKRLNHAILGKESDVNREEIRQLIVQLSSNQNQDTCCSIIERLGEIARDSNEAIQVLINLIRTTSNDEIFWAAIDSLGKIDPKNSFVDALRGRFIDLGIEIAGETIALVVILIRKSNQEVGVILQVYPTGSEDVLPPDLKLILFDRELGEEYITTARETDNYIQRQFIGLPGEQYTIKLVLNDKSFTEELII